MYLSAISIVFGRVETKDALAGATGNERQDIRAFLANL